MRPAASCNAALTASGLTDPVVVQREGIPRPVSLHVPLGRSCRFRSLLSLVVLSGGRRAALFAILHIPDHQNGGRLSSMSVFKLKSDWGPAGDQPKAIEGLVQGLKDGKRHQTLLGVTGSGKTFSMANVIAQYGKPTLV